MRNLHHSQSDNFPNLITNGAKWYSVNGGLQDYSYIKYGTLHFTIEVSLLKFPEDNYVKHILFRHRQALHSWLRKVTNMQAIFGRIPYNPNSKVEFRELDDDANDSEGRNSDQIRLRWTTETGTIYWTVSDSDGYFKKPIKPGFYRVFIDGRPQCFIHVGRNKNRRDKSKEWRGPRLLTDRNCNNDLKETKYPGFTYRTNLNVTTDERELDLK